MNNTIVKALVKQLIPVVKSNLPAFENKAVDMLNKVELLDGETYAAFVATNTPDGLYITTCTFNNQDQCTRQIQSIKATELIEKIITEI